MHVVVVLAPAEAGAGRERLGDVVAGDSAEPSAIWKAPPTNAGLSGIANISACSVDIE